MKVKIAKNAGFCFGVNRAVTLVNELVNSGESVSTLGPISHNKQVVGELAQRGVTVVDKPQNADKNRILVIRSHGVGKDVYSCLNERGIRYADATCPFVAKIHNIVKEQSENGAVIVIAGDITHPEVIGIMGFCKTQPYTIESEAGLDKLLEDHPNLIHDKVCLVAQTTFNVDEWKKILKKFEKVCTNSIFFGTICNATSNRQLNAYELARSSDAMIVVGGRHSSNTIKLFNICSEMCERTYLIESASELEHISFSEDDNIGITAGASTPASIIKEVLDIMSEKSGEVQETMKDATVEESAETESFKAMLDESFKNNSKGERNDKVFGIVESIEPNAVYVSLDGRKQTGYIPLDELSNDPTVKPEDIVSVGDKLELLIMRTNDQEGTIMCSKRRIDANKGWDVFEKALEDKEILHGVVTEVVKGGVIVVSNAIRVFVPGSLATASKREPIESLLQKEVDFRLIELDKRRRRALGSIREVLKERSKAAKEAFWSTVEEGKEYTGVVKSLTSYGAFVDIGGVDGMVHISELSWSRIKHPSEVVNVGDTVNVYVKAIDREKENISLGYKREEDSPWNRFVSTYKVGDVISVTIDGLTTFGAFAVIIPGVKGLIHISQIADHRVEDPADELKKNQTVTVKITDINTEKRRVSLSIKAAMDEVSGDAVVASTDNISE